MPENKKIYLIQIKKPHGSRQLRWYLVEKFEYHNYPKPKLSNEEIKIGTTADFSFRYGQSVWLKNPCKTNEEAKAIFNHVHSSAQGNSMGTLMDIKTFEI